MDPTGYEGFIVDTKSFIDMIHELNTISTSMPWPNGAPVTPPSNTEIALWQTLFDFTAADAESELIKHREGLSAYDADAETLAKWPWERCQALGFDLEAYNYWLRMTDQHSIKQPRDTATFLRQAAESWALFLSKPVDQYISRWKCAPEIQEPTRRLSHKIYDREGIEHSATVLRA